MPYTKKELLKNPFWQKLHEQDRVDYRHKLQQAMALQNVDKIIDPDLGKVPIEKVKPLRNEGGTFLAFEDPDTGLNYNRPDPVYGDWYGQNNNIHHNEITYLGMYGASGIVDDGEEGTDYYMDYNNDSLPDWGCYSESANNLFDYNIYHHNGIPEKFEYCETWYLNWEQFQAAGQEPNGTMDSNVIPPDDTPPLVCPICPGN